MNLIFSPMNNEIKTMTSKYCNTMQAQQVRAFKDSLIFGFATI